MAHGVGRGASVPCADAVGRDSTQHHTDLDHHHGEPVRGFDRHAAVARLGLMASHTPLALAVANHFYRSDLFGSENKACFILVANNKVICTLCVAIVTPSTYIVNYTHTHTHTHTRTHAHTHTHTVTPVDRLPGECVVG